MCTAFEVHGLVHPLYSYGMDPVFQQAHWLVVFDVMCLTYSFQTYRGDAKISKGSRNPG